MAYIKRLFGIFIILLFLTASVSAQGIPEFTEDFTTNLYLQEYNFSLESNKAKDGYVVPYYPSDSWLYEWGNLFYTNGKLYIVWSDQRDDGYYHIYLAKIQSSDLSHLWSTNFRVDENIGEGYRPDITLYDSSSIYISWGSKEGGLWRLKAQKIDDTGASPSKGWGSAVRVDTVGDDAHYWVEKVESTVSPDNKLYISTVWQRIGSGDRGFAYAVSNTGGVIFRNESGYWLGVGTPPGFPRGCDTVFAGTNVYVTAQGWMWSPSRDFGAYIQKLTSQSGARLWGNSTNLDTRDTLAGYYPDAEVPVIAKNGYIYSAWADRRDGDYDIFLQKVDITNGNHPSGWGTDKKVNITTSGEQLYPDIAFRETTGNIYIVWKDTTTSNLKLMEYKSDGSGANFGSDVVLTGITGTPYHPKIVTDENDNIYIAWLEYDEPYYKINVAKYNSSGVLQSGPTNAIKVNYMIKSHSISTKLDFTPPALSVEQAMVTNLNANTNGGGIEIYLSHNGGNTWTLATNGIPTTFSGPGWDFRYKIVFTSDGHQRPEVDDFKIKALQYYTGDLLYSHSSNTNFNGEGVIEGLAYNQEITNYVLANGTNKATNYVKLKNTGNVSANFYIYGYGSDANFDVQYYDGANDITSLVTSWTGYLVSNLGAGSNKLIRVEITPKLTATEGMEKYIYISSYVGKGEGLHDSIRLKTVAWKYYPDLLVKRKDGNFIGDDIREYPSVITQKVCTNANSFISNFEETSTNYLLVQNDGLSTDIIKLSAVTNITNGSINNWIISITNITTGTKLNLPANLNINAGVSNLIAVLIKPKSSSSEGENLSLEFEINSLNTVPSSDHLRMDKAKISVTSIKVQPDLYVSSTPAFTNNIGENTYSFTNTSATQSLLLKTVPEKTLSFYVRVRNNGQTADTINVKIDKLPNTNWQNSYNDGTDITSQITNANGVNYSLAPGGYKTITCAYTPNTNVPSGETLNLKMIARSLSKQFVVDELYLRPYSKKLRPDLLISTNNNTFIGSNYYTTNGISQSFYKRLEIETEESQTYYLKIVNKSPTDPDTIIYRGDGGNNNYWSVQYFDTNNNDITSSVTNGTNVTLNVDEAFLIRMKVKPSVLTPPDDLKNIYFRIYSEEVPSQMDVAVFSNIGVELKPDLIIDSFGGNMYRDNNYNDQTKSVDSISGVSNSYIIKLQNDGGSVESFRLKSYYSNVGGDITNWIISFKTNGVDITSSVTQQSGHLFESLNPGETVQIELTAYPKFYGLNSTNSAVGDKLYIRLDAESVTKSIRRDMGTLLCNIKRGMPDIYLQDGYIGKNRQDTTFNQTNKFVLGVVLNYPRSTTVWLKNNGIYTDSFNYYVSVVSNNTNWSFSFTNESQDITDKVTNTNVGFSFTNAAGMLKAIKFTIVATQGNVGDMIYFYNYFKAVSEKEREDRIWFIGQIVDGLPDIAVSNYQDANLYGWGQGATNDYINSKIETNETNQFLFLLRNEATGGGSADFIFKEYDRTGANSTVEYYTNGVLIPYSDITNGITFSIPSSNYIPLKVKIYDTGTSSGDTTELLYRLNLSGYNDVYDEFNLTSIRVDPNIYIGFTNTTSESQTFYMPKESETEFYVIITNQDVVGENFRIKATPSDNQYLIRYYKCSNNVTNEITSDITNNTTGWLTGILNSGDNVLLKVRVRTTNTNTLKGGDFKLIDIQGAPLKNESKVEHLYAKVLIVEGVPDLSALDENNNKIGDGKDASVEYISEKIKIYETNTYKIFLENDITGTGPVHIILREITNSGKDKFELKYFDKSLNDITSEITNTGKEFYLSAGGQDYIFLKIIGYTNTQSGEKCFAKLRFWMKYQSNNYDEFTITNTMVNPKVNVKVANIYNRIWDFNDYSDSLSFKTIRNVGVTFYIGIRNEDVIGEQMRVQASEGNSTWSIKYYDELDNDITDDIVSGVYETKTLGYNEFYRIRGYVLPSASALPADTINVNITAAPLENLTQTDSANVSVTIDCTYVKGKVVDKATGLPISDATIYITDAYGIKTSGKSDSEGNFSVPVYPQYNVKFVALAEAKSYVGQRKEFISTAETNYINFELVPLRLTADKLDCRIFPHPISAGSGGNFIYSVPRSGEVKLLIFDLYGKLVKKIVDEHKERGVYYAIWDGTAEDGSTVNRGVYVYLLKTEAGKVVRKLFIK